MGLSFEVIQEEWGLIDCRRRRDTGSRLTAAGSQRREIHFTICVKAEYWSVEMWKERAPLEKSRQSLLQILHLQGKKAPKSVIIMAIPYSLRALSDLTPDQEGVAENNMLIKRSDQIESWKERPCDMYLQDNSATTLQPRPNLTITRAMSLLTPRSKPTHPTSPPSEWPAAHTHHPPPQLHSNRLAFRRQCIQIAVPS